MSQSPPTLNRNTMDQRPILPPISSMNIPTTASWPPPSKAIPIPNSQHRHNSFPQIISPVPYNASPPIERPTLKNIESDIEQVLEHCTSLVDNMNKRKHTITDQFDGTPWLDDMIKKSNEVLNALLRLRKHQIAVENTRKFHTMNTTTTTTTASTHKEKNGWSNVQGRLRKRGKRPATEHRCHSCNISETPEWRRGPDGARTLCNACGLHYAKLTRKKKVDDNLT